MGGGTLGLALGRRSISDKILVDYFVTRERPLYYFSLKLSCLLCIHTMQRVFNNFCNIDQVQYQIWHTNELFRV